MDKIEVFARALDELAGIGSAAISRSVVDRSSELAGLHAALLGVTASVVVQSHCTAAALRSVTPQGVAVNVRASFEGLVTVRYLTERPYDKDIETRLERYLRGARAQQVKLRSMLSVHPLLERTFLIDPGLAQREKDELNSFEAGLPKEERIGGKHWSGLPEGLRSVTEQVGLLSDYDVLYRLQSGLSHANRPWDSVLVEGGHGIGRFRHSSPRCTSTRVKGRLQCESLLHTLLRSHLPA